MPLPIALRDWGYQWVAKNRKRLVKNKRCEFAGRGNESKDAQLMLRVLNSQIDGARRQSPKVFQLDPSLKIFTTSGLSTAGQTGEKPFITIVAHAPSSGSMFHQSPKLSPSNFPDTRTFSSERRSHRPINQNLSRSLARIASR